MESKHIPKTGLAGRVRERMREGGRLRSRIWSPADMASELDVTDPARVREAFRDMARRGEIRKVGRGSYVYDGIDIGNIATRPGIYRAIHVTGSFTVREIALLTDATRHYVRQIVRALIAEGFVERAGRKSAPPGAGWSPVYRVRNPDGLYLKYCLRSGLKMPD